VNKRQTYSILQWARQQYLTRGLLWLILLNFVNLSVNFQESQLNHLQGSELEDPIDTLCELVYEWALDGDCDVIPDNGTEQEDKSLKKGKIWGIALAIPSPLFFNNIEKVTSFPTSFSIPTQTIFKDSPPPDRS
jgi:hypothetical protein